MTPELPRLLLTPTKNQLLKRAEHQYWDYKRQLDVSNTKELEKLAKYVLGFHNAQGGVLIIGVDDDYSVPGVPRSTVADSTLVRQRLQRYIGPSVSVFTDEIEINAERSVWLIFAPKRQGAPVAVQTDGVELRRHEYYVRVDTELKRCVEPIDFERAFAGVSGAHLSAYIYSVDQPFFRLLAPHCEQFVGRGRLIDEVIDAIGGRYPVVGLDGVGGVGKSAIAIEVTRRLFSAGSFQFVVSLSAKSRVWQGQTATRRAAFTGLTEFLHEIARVLQLDISPDVEATKRDIISLMRGNEGLLLIDNVEDIQDEQVLYFLSREVPEPVKVLVTSRIDRGYGGLFISVPEMTEEEARELLFRELEQARVAYDPCDKDSIAGIINATGRLPLALKWAAGLAAHNGSLQETKRVFLGTNARKLEFLSFCFATMFETLSPAAKETALLSPFLLDDWNVPCVALALERSEEEIVRAFAELKQRGLILATDPNEVARHRMLPLTMDFLASSTNKNEPFRKRVRSRLDELLGSPDLSSHFLSWPEDERVERFVERAYAVLHDGRCAEALRLVRAAQAWAPSDSRLQFLQGRIDFESGRVGQGIDSMTAAFQKDPSAFEKTEDRVYLACALMTHGSPNQQEAALSIFEGAVEGSLTEAAVERYITVAFEYRDYRSVQRSLRRITAGNTLLSFAKALEPYLDDVQVVHSIGADLLSAAGRLRSAGGSQHIAATLAKVNRNLQL